MKEQNYISLKYTLHTKFVLYNMQVRVGMSLLFIEQFYFIDQIIVAYSFAIWNMLQYSIKETDKQIAMQSANCNATRCNILRL